MPIVFEEVTGEVAPPASTEHGETTAAAPDTQNDAREKLLWDLALLRERQHRLFCD